MFIIGSEHNPAPSKCGIKGSGYYQHVFPKHTAGLQHPLRTDQNNPHNQQISPAKLKDDLPKIFFYSSPE